MEENTKKNLKIYGLFFGIILLMTAILILTIIVSRDSWKKGLSNEIQKVLDSNSNETYIVDKFVDVDSIMSTSSAVYSLLKVGAGQKEKYYGIIVRVPSIIGPIPAVFVCSDKDTDKIKFVGYAGDFGIAADTIDIRISSGIMNYWKKMVPSIIEKAKNQENKKES